MKKDIHPSNYREVAFKDNTSGEVFIINSCVETEDAIKHGGKEYPLYEVEISSASHPFYTGKKTTIDRAGRVEKFLARDAAAKK